MVTRYEMWQYSPKDDVEKSQLLHNISYNLKALVGVVPGLIATQLICSNEKSSHDILIVTSFEKSVDLDNYDQDGAYQVFAAVYLEPYFQSRAVVDKVV